LVEYESSGTHPFSRKSSRTARAVRDSTWCKQEFVTRVCQKQFNAPLLTKVVKNRRLGAVADLEVTVNDGQNELALVVKSRPELCELVCEVVFALLVEIEAKREEILNNLVWRLVLLEATWSVASARGEWQRGGAEGVQGGWVTKQKLVSYF
jgi:hypothetical protein